MPTRRPAFFLIFIITATALLAADKPVAPADAAPGKDGAAPVKDAARPAADADAKPAFASPKVEPVPAELPADQKAPPVVEEQEEKDAPSPLRSIPKPPSIKNSGFFGKNTRIVTISLGEAIQSALGNNLDARIEEVGISLEQARVLNAYGAYDPVLSFSASRGSTQTPDNRNNITSADAIAQLQAIQAQIDAINSNTAANQAFTNAVLAALGRPLVEFDTTPLTSGFGGSRRIVFDNESDRGELSLQARSPIGTIIRATSRVQKTTSTFDGDTRAITPNYIASTSVEFRQPLLKDFGFAANLADIRIARKNREAQELTWRFRLEATLQSVASSYFDMLFGMNDLTNKGDAITAGLKLVAHSARRKELGFFSPYEVKQAQVQLSFDRENLLVAKNNYYTFQIAMKRLVLPDFDSARATVLLPVKLPTLKAPKLERDALLAVAFEKRLDYKAAIIAAESEDVRLKFARNQLWPQLDVVGSFGWAGLDSSYPSAIGQMMEGQAPSWQLGVTGSVPLGSVQPRAQLSAAKARKEQAILRVKSAELEVGLSVDRAIEIIRTNQLRLETAQFTTRSADEAVRVGFRRMEEGLISNFDLIEQQRRLYEARTRELSAVAELNKSITQLWLATGTVLENLNITIPEARPVPKNPSPTPERGKP